MKKDCESLILHSDCIEDPVHWPHYIYWRDIVSDFYCKQVCGYTQMQVCEILQHAKKIEEVRKYWRIRK